MSDRTRKSTSREDRDTATPPQQNKPEIEPDETERGTAPGVQDNGRPASNGQADAPDPLDLESLRLSQDFAEAVGVKRIIATVPIRKPSREVFIRVHPDSAYQLETLVLELKEDREVYVISRPLWSELATEPTVSSRLLVTAMTRQGVLFVWPLKLPGPDGRIDDWSRSALEAADLARTQWVRVTADLALGAYALAVAPSPHHPVVARRSPSPSGTALPDWRRHVVCFVLRARRTDLSSRT
jgi:hypothetical protein